jgi:gliding motility-associated-like protein
LYELKPDDITTRDTIVFLGAPVPIRLSSTCANGFSWSPREGVFLPDVGKTSIVPPTSGVFVYTLAFSDPISSCKASDSIRITVVDPRTLTCDQVLLPNTFTPNNDGINDVFGISNPYAIGELYLFEIFDRWGGRMFVTTSPFAQWDGNFQGQAVNPGVYWYKIIHVCDGDRRLVTGSILVMK